ncbi:MAG TPA: hypothetical protein VHT52_01770 [Stellaceae bacterium]|nr:hypothetical protein [Stellaceae bacterium]
MHEFVCADCKADVFSFGGAPDETRCVGCETVRELMPMSPEKEAELRDLLGCQLPKDDADDPPVHHPA